MDDDIALGVKALHYKHNTEARNAVAWLGAIVNGSWANNHRNESYRSMILQQWHNHLKNELQPMWADEVNDFKANRRRQLHDVAHDHPPPNAPPGSPPPNTGVVTGGGSTSTPEVCPVAKPTEHATCAYSASPDLSCHYDEVCCPLTGNCYNTTITTCVVWDYWIVTTKALDCAEARSPSAPPPPPYPNVFGVNDTMWERAIASALAGVEEDEVHVTIADYTVSACIHTPSHTEHWDVIAGVRAGSFTSHVEGETGMDVEVTRAPYSQYPS
jgi:hypothetical protein